MFLKIKNIEIVAKKEFSFVFKNDDKSLCVNCDHQDFETVEGRPKCYWRCPFRNTRKMDTWM